MNHAILPNGPARAGLSVAALTILALPLAGCGDKLDCSADETRGLVYQIAEKQFRQVIPPNEYPDLKFSLADIVTRETGKNKATCAARLHITMPVNPQTMPNANKPFVEHDMNITYNLERTDDGRLVATVYGL